MFNFHDKPKYTTYMGGAKKLLQSLEFRHHVNHVQILDLY
jgi:hypothetical protein